MTMDGVNDPKQKLMETGNAFLDSNVKINPEYSTDHMYSTAELHFTRLKGKVAKKPNEGGGTK